MKYILHVYISVVFTIQQFELCILSHDILLSTFLRYHTTVLQLSDFWQNLNTVLFLSFGRLPSWAPVGFNHVFIYVLRKYSSTDGVQNIDQDIAIKGRKLCPHGAGMLVQETDGKQNGQ